MNTTTSGTSVTVILLAVVRTHTTTYGWSVATVGGSTKHLQPLAAMMSVLTQVSKKGSKAKQNCDIILRSDDSHQRVSRWIMDAHFAQDNNLATTLAQAICPYTRLHVQAAWKKGKAAQAQSSRDVLHVCVGRPKQNATGITPCRDWSAWNLHMNPH